MTSREISKISDDFYFQIGLTTALDVMDHFFKDGRNLPCFDQDFIITVKPAETYRTQRVVTLSNRNGRFSLRSPDTPVYLWNEVFSNALQAFLPRKNIQIST